jgi:predicted methyltransferase
MEWASGVSRRVLMVGAVALSATACGRKPAADQPPKAAAPDTGDPAQRRGTLPWAVAGTWREADKPRDRWRHPIETLEFFGLKPSMTVVELWPGAGWYTQILAPLLAAGGGKLYAAGFDSPGQDPAAAEVAATYRRTIEGRPALYGKVEFTSFGPNSGPLAPAGTADMVLFLRNLHDWMAAGLAEKAFRDALAALKPGGVLGIEEHRAAPGGPQDPLAETGYVQEAYVKQLAEEAGFRFDKSSEINANPADTRNHPFGVWTLPPTRRSSPMDKPADPAFDHAKYDAIGESDRMTLRFIKP